MGQECLGQKALAWRSIRFHLKAALGVLKHGFHLASCDAGKPSQKIVDTRPVFQIFKQRLYRYPSSAEHPRTTDFAGDAFDTGAK